MKKLLSIVFVFAIIVSCNNKTKVVGGVKEKTYDTAFNEKIQGMFFGFPLEIIKRKLLVN